MKHKQTEKIIILGVTEAGETFKPSDWAERVSGSLCTFEDHRIHYSPLLQPLIYQGQKCIMLDHKLKYSNPDLYNYILGFAKTNKLKICTETDE